MDFIAAKANVGSGSKVAAVNVAFIAAVSMNLAPVLCRIKFLGQTHFGAGANSKCVGFTSATQSQSL